MSLKRQRKNEFIPMSAEHVRNFINNQTLQGLIGSMSRFGKKYDYSKDEVSDTGTIIAQSILYAIQNDEDWEKQFREYLYNAKIFEVEND